MGRFSKILNSSCDSSICLGWGRDEHDFFDHFLPWVWPKFQNCFVQMVKIGKF